MPAVGTAKSGTMSKDLMRSWSSETNPLVPTNMLGSAVPHRLAMGLPPRVPVELKGKVFHPLSTAAAQRSSTAPQGRFGATQWLTPSVLGGNTLRVSASDQALLSGNPLLRLGRLGGGGGGGGGPPRQITRDPITGDEADRTRQPMGSSQHTLTMPNGQPVFFPAKGTIRSVGSEFEAHQASSPAARAKSEKLQYEIWREAQRRSAAERELRSVEIHGRSRPPWVGDAASSGYMELYPQTR